MKRVKLFPTVGLLVSICSCFLGLSMILISLWLSGVIPWLPVPSKLPKIGDVTETTTTPEIQELVPSSGAGICRAVPEECRKQLPYQWTSTELPFLSNFRGDPSSVDSCFEDGGKSLIQPFLCFLKYPPCAKYMPDVCATSCPSMHCLARTARRSNITNYEFTSFPTPDSERTHQLSNPDIIRESCKLYDSNCVDLGKVEPCKKDEVRCLMSGACLSPEWRCNGINDCGFWEDEVNCQACSDDEFTCASGECISMQKRCDGFSNCLDDSDEQECNMCFDGQFSCGDGKCVPDSYVCDGDYDCSNGRDEEGCSCRQLNGFECNDGTCYHKSRQCDGHTDCLHGEDELNCGLTARGCERDEFFCKKDSKCVQRDYACSSGCAEEICTCKKSELPICGGLRTFPSMIGMSLKKRILSLKS